MEIDTETKEKLRILVDKIQACKTDKEADKYNLELTELVFGKQKTKFQIFMDGFWDFWSLY